MFDDAAFEVAGYTGVEVSGTAGEDVDAIGAVHFRSGKSRSLTRQNAAGSG
jgi:hypothetical protein